MLLKFTGPLILTFLISVFLLLMQFLWKYIDDLVGKGLDGLVIAELLFYASLTLVPLALPLSVLLASLMTFGNLGEQYELFAMKSSGISLLKIMRPLIIMVLIISGLSFVFTNNVLPVTNLKMRSLLFSIQQEKPEINLQNGIFTDAIDGFSIRVEDKDKETKRLNNLMIYDHRSKDGNKNITLAESGSIKMTEDKSFLILNLKKGSRYEELKSNNPQQVSKNTRPHQTTHFVEQTMYIELDGLGLDRNNEDMFKNGFEMLNIWQLEYAMDSLITSLTKRKNVIKDSYLNYNVFKGQAKPANNTQNPDYKDQAKNQGANNSNLTDSAINKDIDTADTDIIAPEFKFDKGVYINLDSLLLSLNGVKRNKTVDFALNYARSSKSYIEMTSSEVFAKARWIGRHDIEWHRKFTVGFACLVLFFVGAPLGAIIRKGGFGTPVVIAVFVFLMYYIVSITFEKMSRELVISAFWGMWTGSLIMLPFGIFLTLKAANDSLIVSAEQYARFIQRFKIKRKRKNNQH
jgi:lipopolysaccharide export system permease protein